MITNRDAASELRFIAGSKQADDGRVSVDPAVLTRSAKLLEDTASGARDRMQRQAYELEWSDMRKTVALRLVHFYAMSGLMLPESQSVRAWLQGWIEAGMSAQLGWPSNLPGTAKLLISWGYQEVGGCIGLRLATDKQATVQ